MVVTIWAWPVLVARRGAPAVGAVDYRTEWGSLVKLGGDGNCEQLRRADFFRDGLPIGLEAGDVDSDSLGRSLPALLDRPPLREAAGSAGTDTMNPPLSSGSTTMV